MAAGECLYVGNMRLDIKAGKSVGMKSIGVLTGFDDYDLLENEHPDLIIETVASLKHHLAPSRPAWALEGLRSAI